MCDPASSACISGGTNLDVRRGVELGVQFRKWNGGTTFHPSSDRKLFGGFSFLYKAKEAAITYVYSVGAPFWYKKKILVRVLHY